LCYVYVITCWCKVSYETSENFFVQEQQPSKSIYDDVLEFIKADYQVSVDGIKTIIELMDSGISDITTYI